MSFDKAARRKDLEARFSALYMERAQVKERTKLIHDELMRIQGELRCLDAIPDSPPDAAG